jgi:hypothetical protein
MQDEQAETVSEDCAREVREARALLAELRGRLERRRRVRVAAGAASALAVSGAVFVMLWDASANAGGIANALPGACGGVVRAVVCALVAGGVCWSYLFMLGGGLFARVPRAGAADAAVFAEHHGSGTGAVPLLLDDALAARVSVDAAATLRRCRTREMEPALDTRARVMLAVSGLLFAAALLAPGKAAESGGTEARGADADANAADAAREAQRDEESARRAKQLAEAVTPGETLRKLRDALLAANESERKAAAAAVANEWKARAEAAAATAKSAANAAAAASGSATMRIEAATELGNAIARAAEKGMDIAGLGEIDPARIGAEELKMIAEEVRVRAEAFEKAAREVEAVAGAVADDPKQGMKDLTAAVARPGNDARDPKAGKGEAASPAPVRAALAPIDPAVWKRTPQTGPDRSLSPDAAAAMSRYLAALEKEGRK